MCMCACACACVGVGVKTSSCVVETYKRGGHGCSCGVSDEKWESGEWCLEREWWVFGVKKNSVK